MLHLRYDGQGICTSGYGSGKCPKCDEGYIEVVALAVPPTARTTLSFELHKAPLASPLRRRRYFTLTCQ